MHVLPTTLTRLVIVAVLLIEILAAISVATGADAPPRIYQP